MKVDKCICFDVLLSQLKEIAEKTGATTLEELQEHVTFGMNCKMCHSYIRKMLKTGKTEFSPF